MKISERNEIIFSILKSIKAENYNIIPENYDINNDLFLEISQFIENEGFIEDILISIDSKVDYNFSSITSKGLEYLEKNFEE